MMYRRIRDKVLFRRRMHIKAQRMADIVIVSTPDLLQLVPKSIHLPNPVDTDHFKPDIIYKKKKEALTLKTEVTDSQCALDYCKENNINLDIDLHDRNQKPILHANMPDFLRQYKIYVDIKCVNDTILQALSKTGLEALACGLKVLDHKLKYCEGLPAQHNP
jgi:hypothetical protein